MVSPREIVVLEKCRECLPYTCERPLCARFLFSLLQTSSTRSTWPVLPVACVINIDLIHVLCTEGSVPKTWPASPVNTVLWRPTRLRVEPAVERWISVCTGLTGMTVAATCHLEANLWLLWTSLSRRARTLNYVVSDKRIGTIFKGSNNERQHGCEMCDKYRLRSCNDLVHNTNASRHYCLLAIIPICPGLPTVYALTGGILTCTAWTCRPKGLLPCLQKEASHKPGQHPRPRKDFGDQQGCV